MIDRRMMVAGLAASALPVRAWAQGTAGGAYGFSFGKPDGKALQLGDYRGRPVLVVNTATRCGFAGQMATLEQLWQRYRGRGLMLVAVPSNDFGGQEPLEGAAIAQAAHDEYGATYTFVDKSVVRGPEAHPFYRWAAALKPAEAPRWNFHKYLIGRDGSLVGGFGTATEPLAPQLVQAIGRELGTG